MNNTQFFLFFHLQTTVGTKKLNNRCKTWYENDYTIGQKRTITGGKEQYSNRRKRTIIGGKEQ